MNNILKVYEEGRLIRHSWGVVDAEGRQLLCLYTALVNDVHGRPSTCPASVAPRWVANLLPAWDDNGTLEAWPSMVTRVGALAPRFGELTGRRERIAIAGAMLAALSNCRPRNALAVDPAIALWNRVSVGDEPTTQEWLDAVNRADDAAAAAYADVDDVDYAAYAAARAAARAGVGGGVGGGGVRGASDCAAKASGADADAYAAATRAAWDRITTAQLDAIEHALNAEVFS